MTAVACAVIDDGAGRVLAVRRKAAPRPGGLWEFPGGKVEAGETPEACVVREIREELALDVRVERALEAYRHDYPDLSLLLLPFACRVTGGSLRLGEHSAARWEFPGDLLALDWAEADLPLLNALAGRSLPAGAARGGCRPGAGGAARRGSPAGRGLSGGAS